jgi:ribose transport system permease protein
MVIGSVGASIAGLLQAGRLGGARYDFGSSDLLIVLAAVVIGGTSMFGGRGSVIGAVVGSLLIGSLTNGLILMNTSVSNQMIAQGAIIVLAVCLSSREALSGLDSRKPSWWRVRAARKPAAPEPPREPVLAPGGKK